MEGDWPLAFRSTSETTIAQIERAIAELAPPATTFVESSGNPRDGFYRKMHVAADLSADLRLEAEVTLSGLGVDSDDNPAEIVSMVLRGPAAFATKLATWDRLRDVLAKHGFRDTTLAHEPGQIVDDAIAAGETALADAWRAQITPLLVAAATGRSRVTLRSQRPDDMNAVLTAYPDPQSVEWVVLDDCGLTDVPPALRRFSRTQSLVLDGARFDGDALRAVSLPHVTYLTLRRSTVRSLRRDDLAGFPALDDLRLEQSQLAYLDPGILDVCPKLASVVIIETPLARDARQLEELRGRWPGVTWYVVWRTDN